MYPQQEVGGLNLSPSNVVELKNIVSGTVDLKLNVILEREDYPSQRVAIQFCAERSWGRGC